jgi:hypothetical protein
MEELEEMVEQSFLLVQVQKMALLMAWALEQESWVLELEQAKQKELELPVAKKKETQKQQQLLPSSKDSATTIAENSKRTMRTSTSIAKKLLGL